MNSENYKVYKHTTPNNKVYIGITKLDVNKRWKNGNGYKHNQYFTRAI
ncbi:putative truncated GIY-YIG endonuclease [Lactobacillus phage LL-Ku]|uniref:Putative truncated GIY-YIG endonuclease n=1 Tax=Lactobacillus phage LL-Ku TaxID=2892343 RepID=F7V9A3_9CAUD|nr:putative truncated GIY-YIG endonuclease [Lactobacillus phage LL-Ku]AAV30164.1 putative truncated GIY-YIG endonuclease [Lactobacillus phage LL-Ku]